MKDFTEEQWNALSEEEQKREIADAEAEIAELIQEQKRLQESVEKARKELEGVK